MNKFPDIEGFMQQFFRLLPDDLNRSRLELEKAARGALNATFSRMNLVTREEFDVQAELLSNTRAALDKLEAKIAAMEKPVRRTRKKRTPTKRQSSA